MPGAKKNSAGAVRTTKANLAKVIAALPADRSILLPAADFSFLEALREACGMEYDELDPVLPPKRTGRWVYLTGDELRDELAERASKDGEVERIAGAVVAEIRQTVNAWKSAADRKSGEQMLTELPAAIRELAAFAAVARDNDEDVYVWFGGTDDVVESLDPDLDVDAEMGFDPE